MRPQDIGFVTLKDEELKQAIRRMFSGIDRSEANQIVYDFRQECGRAKISACQARAILKILMDKYIKNIPSEISLPKMTGCRTHKQLLASVEEPYKDDGITYSVRGKL